MAEQTEEELSIKAEIKAALFMQAFEALVMEVARRDPRLLDATAPAVMDVLRKFSARGFNGGPKSALSGETLRKFQEEGHQSAYEDIRKVFGRLARRVR